MGHEPESGFTPTVVLVNDEPLQLGVLCDYVREAGLRPRAFSSAETALAEMSGWAGAAGGSPDALPALVVTDLYMPGIDGWRFCRLLRSPDYAAFNKIPILVVSATFAGDQANRIAADLGAHAFLSSPVDGKRFKQQIQAILRGAPLRAPLRALIVDDSRTMSSIITKAFELHGYEADTARTIKEAVALFTKSPYDVAVLDYHLPDGTGDELLDALHARRPECPCLMVTTDPSPELALDWMKRGAAAYVRKPFEPAYLVELCAKARRERSLLRAEDLLDVRTRELQQSEQILKATQRMSRIGGWAYDVETRDATWTEEVYRIHEFDPADPALTAGCLVEKSIACYEPADRSLVEAAFRRCVDQGEPYDLELQFSTAGGNRLWVRTAGQPVLDKGRVVRIIGSIMDITERKRAEIRLRESEERLEMAQSAAKAGVWDWDVVTGHFEWSAHMFELFGLDPRRHTASFDTWRSVVHPADAEGAGLRIDQALQQRTMLNSDYRVVLPDGSLRWVNTIGQGKYDELGRPIRMVGIGIDITGRRRAEEEKARLESQLEQAQKMESVGRLAGGIAHDFNNILSAIIGYGNLALLKMAKDDPQRLNVEQMLEAGARAAHLTKDLLLFSRKQAIERHPVELNRIVRGVEKFLGRVIGEDVDCRTALCPGDLTVLGDAHQLDQVLMNLATNARDAMPGGGTFSITTSREELHEDLVSAHGKAKPGSYALLEVSDTGGGMDTATLEHIFEPFFTTKEPGKGTGLGLSVVFGIIKQHEGFVDVRSAPGAGTTFRVYLPLSPPSIDKEPGREEKFPAGGTETILIAEDDETIRNMNKTVLESFGYTVIAVRDGQEAVETYCGGKDRIGLLLFDIVMPKKTGREAYDAIRALTPGVKVLFTSGYAPERVDQKLLLEDRLPLLRKPHSPMQLLSMVRSILDGSGAT